MVDLFEHLAALRREGQSFAMATVVGRRAPVSAHLGDRAIVYADGRMEGFIGGACSREIVRQQALESLRTRRGRLLSIRPEAVDGAEDDTEHVVVRMSCASEGAVDVFVEPFGPSRALVVVGATPIADAVARLARGMDYDVVRVVDARERRDVEPDASALGMTVVALDTLADVVRAGGPDRAAVVASQGHYDEEALETILTIGRLPYVGLVASRARGATVRAWLEERGVPSVATVRNPAGIDLGARAPNEVALSILAEIVQIAASQPVSVSSATPVAPGPSPASAWGQAFSIVPSDVSATSAMPAAADPPPGAASALDPVCGMTVQLAAARHTAEVDGVIYYFCCPHCRARFVKDPQQYLSPTP